MLRAVLPFFILLSACASSSTSSGSAATRPATQTISGIGLGTMTVTTAAVADVEKLPYTPDAVFRILPSIFDSLGIPVTQIDQATKTVGNRGYKVRQRLGKVPLSRYIDCGNTQIGPNADSYDVFLGVLTTVTPGPGGTTTAVTTIVDAQARPITYNQAYNRCSSRGGIEAKITDLVKARLSK